MASSSEVYGNVDSSELPAKEKLPLKPLSPYAVSKAAMELLAYQFFKAFGIDTVVLRVFNCDGPGREPFYAINSFARQIVAYEKQGLRCGKLEVGDIDVVRDFLDVRDVVTAYEMAALKCDSGEVYNVCSGRAYSLREAIALLLEESHLEEVEIVKKENLLRLADIRIIFGDPSKFRSKTDWQPMRSFRETLRDILAYWRGA